MLGNNEGQEISTSIFHQTHCDVKNTVPQLRKEIASEEHMLH